MFKQNWLLAPVSASLSSRIRVGKVIRTFFRVELAFIRRQALRVGGLSHSPSLNTNEIADEKVTPLAKITVKK